MSTLQLAAPCFEPPTHLSYDLLGWHSSAGLLEPRPSSIRTGVKLGLHAPVVHRLAHSRFEKVGQRFTFA